MTAFFSVAQKIETYLTLPASLLMTTQSTYTGQNLDWNPWLPIIAFPMSGVSVCLIPFASYFPLLGLFQGANNALYSTFVATSALAVRVVSTYALQEIPEISYRMIWWNALFGWGVDCLITWVHFCRGKWKPTV